MFQVVSMPMLPAIAKTWLSLVVFLCLTFQGFLLILRVAEGKLLHDHFAPAIRTVQHPSLVMVCRGVYLVWYSPRAGEPLQPVMEPAHSQLLWIMLPPRDSVDGPRPSKDHEGRWH